MLKRGANVSFRESFPIFSSGSDQATHVIVGKFGGFPLVTCKYGGFQNSGTPKWMVYMENPIEIMIWGYHHLRKHPYGAGVIWMTPETSVMTLIWGQKQPTNQPPRFLRRIKKDVCKLVCWLWKSVPKHTVDGSEIPRPTTGWMYSTCGILYYMIGYTTNPNWCLPVWWSYFSNGLVQPPTMWSFPGSKKVTTVEKPQVVATSRYLCHELGH